MINKAFWYQINVKYYFTYILVTIRDLVYHAYNKDIYYLHKVESGLILTYIQSHTAIGITMN